MSTLTAGCSCRARPGSDRPGQVLDAERERDAARTGGRIGHYECLRLMAPQGDGDLTGAGRLAGLRAEPLPGAGVDAAGDPVHHDLPVLVVHLGTEHPE